MTFAPSDDLVVGGFDLEDRCSRKLACHSCGIFQKISLLEVALRRTIFPELRSVQEPARNDLRNFVSCIIDFQEGHRNGVPCTQDRLIALHEDRL